MVHGPVPGGGSVSLLDLIDRYGEAIAADLQDIGVNLLDYFAAEKRLPARHVLRLLSQLPDTSRLTACILADPSVPRGSGKPEPWRSYHGWGQERHMLADLIDITIATAPRKKGSKPKPYPRPDVKQQSGTPLSQMLPRRRPPTPST